MCFHKLGLGNETSWIRFINILSIYIADLTVILHNMYNPVNSLKEQEEG